MLASAPSQAATIPILTDAAAPMGRAHSWTLFNPRTVAIGRGLCRVYFFKPKTPMRRYELAGAAWLFAESHAPVANAQTLILKRNDGAEIWQWEQPESFAGAPQFGSVHPVPETLLQKPGEGWRQVRTALGYEAQYWLNGELQASMWRRNPFTERQWRAFALTAISSTDIVPPPLPAPVSAPMSVAFFSQREVLHKDALWRDVARLCSILAIGAFCMAAYLYGQTVTAYLNARNAPSMPPAQLQSVLNDVQDLAAVAPHRPDVKPIVALAEARALANQFGVTLSSWRIDRKDAELTFAAIQSWATPDDIAATFERSTHFKNVTPEFLPNGGLRLKAKMEEAS